MLFRSDFHYHPQATILSSAHPDPEQELAAVRTFLGDAAAAKDESQRQALDQVLAHRLRGQVVRCRVRPLAAILAETGLTRVDLLKIDVERSELEVLAGIGETDWPRIGQVVMEVHDRDGRLGQVVELLAARGYQVRVRRDQGMSEAGLCNLFAQRPDWRMEGAGCELSPAALERLANGPVEPWPTPEAILQGARAHLAATLPDYMVPTHFLALPHFPLTGSGKVDRKALPHPAAPAQGGEASQGPRDEVERELARVFARVLAGNDAAAPAAESIDIHTGFFELGGDSLKCIAVLAELGPVLSLEISMPEFLANLSIARLAALAREKRQAREGARAGRSDPEVNPAPDRRRLTQRGHRVRLQTNGREAGEL